MSDFQFGFKDRIDFGAVHAKQDDAKKQALREDLARQVDEFISSGRSIEQCAYSPFQELLACVGLWQRMGDEVEVLGHDGEDTEDY